jgi:hypothetical protein
MLIPCSAPPTASKKKGKGKGKGKGKAKAGALDDTAILNKRKTKVLAARKAVILEGGTSLAQFTGRTSNGGPCAVSGEISPADLTLPAWLQEGEFFISICIISWLHFL